MIHLSIPGFGERRLEHAVFDFNGTLAVDGTLIAGVREKLQALSSNLQIHVLTADTFGSAAKQLDGLPCKVTVICSDGQDVMKRSYIENLNPESCVCFGNGRNDKEMLKAAGLGIAVIQREGSSAETLFAARVVCSTIIEAIELLEQPKRLTATLRY
jgi:soluble P-type ATPase